MRKDQINSTRRCQIGEVTITYVIVSVIISLGFAEVVGAQNGGSMLK
jgi:hypothetical protein